jgi:predicted ATPase/class 3 adenylate cyclase
VPLPATPDVSPTQGEAAPVVPSTPDAERRQLTVLFCDLVDSTVLASQLDPEDWRDVVRAYQETCAKVIARFEGHIAQYLGDGLLVYFGYPLAHEDDAQRAVRAGLGMIDALGQLNTRLEQERGVRLAARLGIHTGLVVVGEVGGGTRQEQLALGETPNLAARLQGMAAPNTLVISTATFQLLGGFFTSQSLGTTLLKGLAQPIEVYRVLYESMARSRLEAVGSTGLTPLVGREQELGLLQERWAQVKAGVGQVVLLSGEAGIGKSRLVQVLTEHVAAEPQVWLTPCQCSPYYQHTALYPMIDLLERVALRFEREESPQQKLNKLEGFLVQYGFPLTETVPLFASLLSLPLPAAYAPLTVSPEQQKQQTFHALLTIVLHIAAQQPVLFVMEDLHWVDPTTLELLSLLIDQSAARRLCLVLTARTEFYPPWPLGAHLTVLPLRRLAPAQVAGIATHVAGTKALPPAVLQEVVRKTDGVPLFVEELTKMVLESDLLEEHADHYTLYGPLPPLAIPATLHDALMARLDRLGAAKGVAQWGATLGRTFAYDLLEAVIPLDVATLHGALAQLVEAELVMQRGLPPQATYTFKHVLIQEAAYHSLLRSTRRQYHQHIAQVTEAQFPEMVETQPALLAHHALRGEVWEKALAYSQQAGEQAVAHSAYREAVVAFEQALGVVQHLPESRDTLAQAIDLRLALDFALWRLGDWGRVIVSLRAAEALAERLGDQRRLAHISSELADGFRVLGDYERALMAGQRALSLAITLEDQALQREANTQLGLIYYHRGDYGRAIVALRQTITALARQSHRTRGAHPDVPEVWARSWLLVCLSQVGAFAEGHAMSAEVLRLAEASERPFDLAVATFGVGQLSLRQGDCSQAIAVFERGLAVCQSHDLRDWLPTLAANVGYAYALAGRLPEALTLLEQAVGQYAALRGGAPHPIFVVWLGEAYLYASRLDEAHTQAQQALEYSRAHQEQGYEAYALQLLGAIATHRAPAEVAQAAAHYCQALTLGEELGMRPLVAQCHQGLGTLYATIGQREQARTALSTAIALYRAMAMTFWLPQTEAALARVEGR